MTISSTIITWVIVVSCPPTDKCLYQVVVLGSEYHRQQDCESCLPRLDTRQDP
jgi:hypothetical protein